MVLDRWRWLERQLPRTRNGEMILDIGCGTGAFSIGMARRGYLTLGLSWDKRNQRVARERATICKAPTTTFVVQDVRDLEQCREYVSKFDVLICCENIEHILNDLKLMRSMADCLKPGGRLLLTTPNLNFIPLNLLDNGPYSTIEDGSHVRRGYSPAMLTELCELSGLVPEEIDYCTGFLSQKLTKIYRFLSRFHWSIAFAALFPLRPLPLLFDRALSNFLNWPGYSICLKAYKPRFVQPNHFGSSTMVGTGSSL